MSETAALTLTKLGYTNVMDVEGGMSAWEAAGYLLH
jgi:rhodanese-related sulfurtransferase